MTLFEWSTCCHLSYLTKRTHHPSSVGRIALVPRRLEMTVTYLEYIPNAGFIGFYRVLWLWKGSLYKGIWKSLVVYCSFYAAISIFYRCVLCLAGSEYWKETFEKFCVFFGKYYHVLPLNFILGFYVTQVISQWWKQYSNLVWTDSLAMDLVSFLPGSGFLKKLKDMRFPLLP